MGRPTVSVNCSETPFVRGPTRPGSNVVAKGHERCSSCVSSMMMFYSSFVRENQIIDLVLSRGLTRMNSERSVLYTVWQNVNRVGIHVLEPRPLVERTNLIIDLSRGSPDGAW